MDSEPELNALMDAEREIVHAAHELIYMRQLVGRGEMTEDNFDDMLEQLLQSVEAYHVALEQYERAIDDVGPEYDSFN